MNICMVLDKHDYERSSRVRGEAHRLAGDGHRVVVVCDHAAGKDAHEIRQEAEIIRLPHGSRIVRFGYMVADGVGLMFFLFKLRWFLALARLHRAKGFNAFHVHDIPTARTVLVLARLIRRPVILDLHENYPVLMRSFLPDDPSVAENGGGRLALWVRSYVRDVKRKLNELTLDPERWARYERRAVSAADHVIVVIEEARDRVAGLGALRDRITIVSNTLSDEFVSRTSSLREDPEIASTYSQRFVIPYFGSLPRFVRIDTLIRAMPDILEHVPDAHLIIVGEIERRLPALRGLVHEMDLGEQVTFESWQPVERFLTYLSMSDVGIFPWEPNGHTNATITWKLFQYMYMQLPVISSECAPLERIISECRCGLVVPGLATDPAKLARAVVRLARDPAERLELGKRGREAVLSRYRWATDLDRLSSLYEQLASG
ncbi:MAG: glycosyltransferase family 4 protein [Gemmatimonadota bacterium]